MRNAGRLKLGYYPLPVEEARNIQALLVGYGPYAAIDPCVGDGNCCEHCDSGIALLMDSSADREAVEIA